jgi:hypothetical protein
MNIPFGFLMALFPFVFSSVAWSTENRNVLVTGYWSPTGVMLEELNPKNPQWQGKNWRGLGYDVHAYFPTDTESTGGVGKGDFRVDFASVFNDFMRLTAELKPVAILSFGQGEGPWEMEALYPPHQYVGWFRAGSIPSTVGEIVRFPIPDSLKEEKIRRSTLPMGAIEGAVKQLGEAGLFPWIDRTEGAGDYVCGFTGYLASWYQELKSDPALPDHVRAAGFIHVNGSLPQAKASMEVSLEALIRSWEK